MTHGKLINNSLTLFQMGSTVKIKDNLVTNPSIEQLESDGWKEVIYSDGNGGIYESGQFIIVETPVTSVISLTPEKQREQAYQNEPLINWDNEMFSCDNFRLERLSPYFFTQNPRYEEALTVWLSAREEIQNKYPDNI